MATLVLYLEDGSSQTVELTTDVVTLGRDPESSISLTCPSVSTHHATLKQRADGWYVQDLGSSNGTRVNGAVIEESEIKEGDRLGFGDIQAIFYLGGVPAPEQAPAEAAAAPAPKKKQAPAKKPGPKKRIPSSAKKAPVKHRKTMAEEEQGCMSTILVMALFAAVILGGLALRHNKETGNNFFGDVFNKVTGGMPTLELKRQSDEPEEEE